MPDQTKTPTQELERKAADLTRTASPLLERIGKLSREYMEVTMELITRKMGEKFPDADLLQANYVGNLKAREQPEEVEEILDKVAALKTGKVTHIVADAMRGEFHLFGVPVPQQA